MSEAGKITLEVGDSINGNTITKIGPDLFHLSVVNIFTRKFVTDDFGNKHQQCYRFKKGAYKEEE